MSSYAVIIETFGMMGFTFVVAMGVAVIIKGIVRLYEFSPSNLSRSLLDYRQRAYNDRIKREKIRKLLITMEKRSDMPFLQYIYQNKDQRTPKENIDDIYDLYNFYKGISKEEDENKDINQLFKYYHGEI